MANDITLDKKEWQARTLVKSFYHNKGNQEFGFSGITYVIGISGQISEILDTSFLIASYVILSTPLPTTTIKNI